MKKLITLSLYNRLPYTKRVLDALAQCEGISEYVVLPVIDRTNFGFDYQDTFIELLHEYAKDKRLNVENPRCHQDNVGCNRNIYTALNTGFRYADFLIHLEDDIILAKDALRYFEWANATYKDDKNVFTIDAYNNEAHTHFPDSRLVKRSQSFKPWGWATWKDRWLEIENRWQYDYSKRQDFPMGGGWDVCMKHCLRGNRCRIYPTLSRCLNIGEIGIHTPSKEWHHNKHDLQFWKPDSNETTFYEAI
jgi:hypothetical protein